MSTSKEVIDHCPICEKEIYFGQAAWKVGPDLCCSVDHMVQHARVVIVIAGQEESSELGTCNYRNCSKPATTRGTVFARKSEGEGELIPVDVVACDQHKRKGGFFHDYSR
ncbi:hypothetical protein J27TS7_08240 [Paenibacillus dendritiformis]|uniref:hypothetical protein n=1 Tax=Paenibacillus dendritiformis TaxID=130049 RepID=UPI001B25C4B1|nr:hypothetical protein [Paenibacillus dendritiformis]GIO71310.1 hypothetical protein J27TS7_08240 [Paenibacillus dendritiformis]